VVGDLYDCHQKIPTEGASFRYWEGSSRTSGEEKMIREARLKAGLTQEEAGNKLGISQNYWSQFETGAINIPPVYFKSLGEFLKINPEILLLHHMNLYEKALRAGIGLDSKGRGKQPTLTKRKV